MTGITFTVSANDEISRALKALAEQDGGLAKASLKNIGELVVRQTRARFAQQIGPNGEAWKALNPEYAAAKKGPGILRESGQLAASIIWQLDGDNLRIGTNKVYGAIHQFGGKIVPRTAGALMFRIGGRLVIAKAVTIPARPYLGISASDASAIIEVIEDHVEMLLEN
jgi:phage virion morphogenesis protein